MPCDLLFVKFDFVLVKLLHQRELLLLQLLEVQLLHGSLALAESPAGFTDSSWKSLSLCQLSTWHNHHKWNFTMLSSRTIGIRTLAKLDSPKRYESFVIVLSWFTRTLGSFRTSYYLSTKCLRCYHAHRKNNQWHNRRLADHQGFLSPRGSFIFFLK